MACRSTRSTQAGTSWPSLRRRPTAWPSQAHRLLPICTITSRVCLPLTQESFAPVLEGWHYYRLLVDRTFQRFFWSPEV